MKALANFTAGAGLPFRMPRWCALFLCKWQLLLMSLVNLSVLFVNENLFKLAFWRPSAHPVSQALATRSSFDGSANGCGCLSRQPPRNSIQF